MDYFYGYALFLGADPQLDVRGGREGVPDDQQACVRCSGRIQNPVALFDLFPAEDRYLPSDCGFQLPDRGPGRDGRVELGEQIVAGAGLLERPQAQVLLVVEAQADELQRRPITALESPPG